MSEIDHAQHIKTIFCDIDGCIFKHRGDMVKILTGPRELLPGVTEAFKQWCNKGYTIVLTTGRSESVRATTVQQIRNSGLFFDHLIMGLPRGQRVIINDIKPGRTENTAECVNIERNKGLENVNI